MPRSSELSNVFLYRIRADDLDAPPKNNRARARASERQAFIEWVILQSTCFVRMASQRFLFRY